MKTLVRAAAIAATAVTVLSACTGSGGGSGSDYRFTGAQQVGSLIPTGERKAVPTFGGDLLSGGRYDLAAYKGKAIVVNFWGTWCGPCTVETPQFAQVYDKYRSRGVSFVGIDVGEAGRSEPQAFVRNYKIDYPIVYDETGQTELSMGNIRVTARPFTVLLDKQHRVAGVYAARLFPDELEPMLNKLVAGD